MHLKNINQNQLAKKMGIRNGTLSDFKKGRIKNPSFKLMTKIADALDISLDEFR
jgi:transcriptional regulator with XRE-family HTH domain